ncbi:MAG: NFACT RNA binding domain-containing protein [Bradymonadaceae bacterium]
MALTQTEIGLVVEEVEQITGRSRVQEVRDDGARRIVLELRSPGVTHHLLISTETQRTRLHFIEEVPEQPPKPSPFVMQLRKWLRRAELTELEQVAGDRIVRLAFETIDPDWAPLESEDRDDPPTRSVGLLLELADRVGNVYLLDDDGEILGRQTAETIAGRELAEGDRWTPPPPPPDPEAGREDRFGLEELPVDDFERSARLEHEYRRLERQDRAGRRLVELRSRLEQQVERLDRRIEHIEEDLADIQRADTYRRWADLLQQAYGEVEPGDDSVVVSDYYREDQSKIEIPLDPSKSLSENIDAYYHEAQRYENAEEMVEERLLKTVDLRDRAREALAAVEAGEVPEELDAIQQFERQLDDEILPETTFDQDDRTSGRERDERTPYRAFRVSSGAKAMVGRSAADNDTLVTRIARGRDLWLHVRNAPGAAVVLRIDEKGAAPASEDLIDAATLAAHFSQRSEDTTVEVSYTKTKHVRKHASHATGEVSIADESTITVEIEDERLERLLETEA